MEKHIRERVQKFIYEPPSPLFPQVSVTNTLMNQSVGAHVLAASSGVRKHMHSESEDSDWSDSEESQTQRDNQIRAVWSQVQWELSQHHVHIHVYVHDIVHTYILVQ